jgi:hypothetical protein
MGSFEGDKLTKTASKVYFNQLYLLFNVYGVTFLRMLKAIIISIVNLSLGDATPYPESSDSIAVQRVIEKGGKDLLFSSNTARRLFTQYTW